MGVQIAMAAAGMAQNSAAAVAAWQAAQKESREIDKQTRVIKEEGKRAAELNAIENAKFLAKQKMAYVVNGVEMAGSPLLILEETENIGDEEVDAIKRRTAAAANFSLGKSKRVLAQGRAAFFDAAAKNVAIAGTAAANRPEGGTGTKTKKLTNQELTLSTPERTAPTAGPGRPTQARRLDTRRA